jgi:glucokinase
MSNQIQSQLAIGVDVGGTKCAAGLVAIADGHVIAHRLQPTKPERGGEAVLADVIDLVHTLREKAPSGRSANCVGVGVAELVSCDGRVVSDATICWSNIHVAERIHAATDLSAFVDADVRAAARGEAHFGAGREFDSFLYVTVGTGISACLVLEKYPFRGARGLTGTFASSPGLIPDENGKLVTGPALEQFAAGLGIASRFAARRPGFSGAAPQVLELADEGDESAWTIVATAGRALGAAIAQLVNMLDPQAVVVGGGLGMADGIYRQSLDEALRDHVWSDLHRDIPLLPASLGNDAGFIGAAIGAAMEERRLSFKRNT